MADQDQTVATTPPAASLLRSGAFSLVASAAPLVVALIALPLLTRRLGTERLGLLALAWAWLGYAALLDFGIGRALTRLVARADGAPDALRDETLGAVVVTAHRLLIGVGAVVGVLGALVAPWYVGTALGVSDSVRTDAVISGVIFALTVPAVTGASVPRAVLEARQQFRDVNLIRMPVTVGTFAVPLLLLPFTASLTVIALTLALLRLRAWWQYHRLAQRVLPASQSTGPSRTHLRPLLRAGAWMTVSNVISPLMTVADRFLIGSVASVSAVALYAVPWEAATKLWMVPGAVTMVLFPAVSRAAVEHPESVAVLHGAGTRLVASLVVPVCALASLFAPVLLKLAGGADYMGDSVTVLRLLCIGLAANCIATVPFALLQACGRARLTAMLHLGEVLPYVAMLWFAVERWGIVGAAAVWSVRATVDAALMSWCAHDVAPLRLTAYSMHVVGVLIVAACAWIGTQSAAAASVPVIVVAVLVSVLPAIWWVRRSDAERAVLGTIGRPA